MTVKVHAPTSSPHHCQYSPLSRFHAAEGMLSFDALYALLRDIAASKQAEVAKDQPAAALYSVLVTDLVPAVPRITSSTAAPFPYLPALCHPGLIHAITTHKLLLREAYQAAAGADGSPSWASMQRLARELGLAPRRLSAQEVTGLIATATGWGQPGGVAAGGISFAHFVDIVALMGFVLFSRRTEAPAQHAPQPVHLSAVDKFECMVQLLERIIVLPARARGHAHVWEAEEEEDEAQPVALQVPLTVSSSSSSSSPAASLRSTGHAATPHRLSFADGEAPSLAQLHQQSLQQAGLSSPTAAASPPPAPAQGPVVDASPKSSTPAEASAPLSPTVAAPPPTPTPTETVFLHYHWLATRSTDADSDLQYDAARPVWPIRTWLLFLRDADIICNAFT